MVQKKHIPFKIKGITVAITNMDAMLDFYSSVFGTEFKALDQYGSTLYSGTWGGMDILFCPATVAGNTAVQNRHQFDVLVNDVNEFLGLALSHGAQQMGEVSETGNGKTVGIYDPDGNSMVIIESKNS